ncbi:hypothetical protein [Latilactobacillus curvatus]|nr:hypothetical protein [Latilactobacillus curvatus]
MAKQKTNWRWVDWLYVFTIVSQLIYIGYYLANYKFNPNKPGIFQWQSVDDVFLMVVD